MPKGTGTGNKKKGKTTQGIRNVWSFGRACEDQLCGSAATRNGDLSKLIRRFVEVKLQIPHTIHSTCWKEGSSSSRANASGMGRALGLALVVCLLGCCWWRSVEATAATTTTATTLSGIYVDNGVGQTVLEDALTFEEQQEIENEILNLLGLPGPRPAVRHLHSSVGKSAPQFLLNVYDQLQQEENESGGGARIRKVRSTDMDILITDADRKAIDESDIIMTFLNKIMANLYR